MSAPTTSWDNDESCTTIVCGDGYHNMQTVGEFAPTNSCDIAQPATPSLELGEQICRFGGSTCSELLGVLIYELC